jgi:hypothetical protein
MSFLKKSMLYAVVLFSVCGLSGQKASAAFGRSSFGAHSMELGFSLLGSSQDDVNTMIKDARANNASSTSDMGSAYELFAQYRYTFSGTIFSMLIRPSYIFQSTTGSGTGGSYDYKLSGFTIFPMLRMVPLENSFIKFFMQIGLGYGRLSADINQGANSVKFSGGNFGAIGGLGADFCFVPDHCLTVEGNLRYLPIQRSIVDSSNGSFSNMQSGAGQEAELNGSDFQTTLSGIQGILAYTMNF